MRYSNIDYTVLYVDPSKSTNGTGATPATAMNTLPASIGSIADRTCYLIRRTAEAKALVLPSGTNSNVTALMFLGMPMAADEMWDLVPQEAKTAWGSDAAEYANIQTTSASCSFQLPYAQQFAMHRIYLCRNGVDASAYLMRLANTEGIGCYSFDHCKFGSRGIDIDRTSYTGEITTSRLCGYVSIGKARMVSLTNSVMNHGACGYSSYAHGFACSWADVLNVDNVQIFSPAASSSSQAFPLSLSDNYAEGVECAIRNVTQTIRLNGTGGQYVPQLLKVQGYIALAVKGITVKTGTPLSATKPTSYQVYSTLLSFENVYEITMDDLDLEYGDCWNVRASIVSFFRSYTSTYVPGADKHIRNVAITLAKTNGIGGSLSYENAASSGTSYAALALDFSSSNAYVFAKCVQVDGISVVNPRGKAFYGECIRLTDSTFEGCVHLKNTIADIRSVKTWFPGKAVNAYDGTHVRVHELECNLENDVYPYSEDPAVGTGFGENANVFVDKSNSGLRPMSATTSRAEHIYQGFGCNNEGAEGHFAFRCANGLCDTWSVHRQGGGASALKLYNNSYTNAGTMVLGRRPFNGMQLLPKTTGRHILKAHIAFKGYAKPAELYRHFFVSAEVGGKTAYSTLHGRWTDDSSAVWVNDSDLTKLVLEMPLDIREVSPVDVRVYFSWYASGGFVYLDPDIELVEA